MRTHGTVSVALVLLALLTGCSSDRTTVANDEPAPPFELDTLTGGRIALGELRGEVVAVRFWADWCPFCRREMRELEPLYQQLRERGLEILAVNVGQDRGRVEHFVERVGYSYPTLLDPDSAVARSYGVIAIPVTYFIDREGIVRGRILGESDAATFERIALPLLDAVDAPRGARSDANRRGGAALSGTPCIHVCTLDGSIPAADTRRRPTHRASRWPALAMTTPFAPRQQSGPGARISRNEQAHAA